MFRLHVTYLRRGVISTSPTPPAGGPPLVECPYSPYSPQRYTWTYKIVSVTEVDAEAV